MRKIVVPQKIRILAEFNVLQKSNQFLKIVNQARTIGFTEEGQKSERTSLLTTKPVLYAMWMKMLLQINSQIVKQIRDFATTENAIMVISARAEEIFWVR